MKKKFIITCCFILITISTSSNILSKKSSSKRILFQLPRPSLLDMDRDFCSMGSISSIPADTIVLAEWTFDSEGGCIREGWTSVDLTEQAGCYWHVADATELNGGDFGGLIVLSGQQSLWCGATPDPSNGILCSYAALPGYGNDWDQGWCFKCIEVPDTEEVYICYDVIWDSEPGYDYTYVEYATKSTCDLLSSVDAIPGNDWVQLAAYDGVGGPTTVCDTIPAGHAGCIKTRFHFVSDGAWSDEDGLWNTDGAIIIDDFSITAQYSGLYDFEDFEDEPPGDEQTTDGDWACCLLTGYGDFAGLYPSLSVLPGDLCTVKPSCLWAFVKGSTVKYSCAGHPDLLAVPRINERGQELNLRIESPDIPLFGGYLYLYLKLTVIMPNGLGDGVFYTIQSGSGEGGCKKKWMSNGFNYFGGTNSVHLQEVEIGAHYDSETVTAGVAIGIKDLGSNYSRMKNPTYCPSGGPYIPYIGVYGIVRFCPQWSVRDIDLFQDTFPTDGTAIGTGRADMAMDILPLSNPGILAGDSVVVTVSDLDYGIGPDPYTGYGPAVYCCIAIQPQNQAGKSGQEIGCDDFRWPVVDSTIGCNGLKWYTLRMDTCFTEYNGPRTGAVPNKFCIDLNDNLFTAGDTINFYFYADNEMNERTYWSQFVGTVIDQCDVETNPMEFQILPSHYCRGDTSEGDILYVDHFSGRGAQPYFETAFQLLGISEKVDRYDVRGPSSFVGNSLSNRVSNVEHQLIHNYRKIIWNSGDLSVGTVGDGTLEKGNDYGLLFQFLDFHSNPNGVGIYFSGDDLAGELNGLTTASSQNFKSVYMPHVLITGDHTKLHRISPFGIGEGAGTGVPPSVGIFDHGPPFGVDTIVVYGGCPISNDFDVIEPVGGSTLEMCYDPVNETDDSNPAVIAYATTNALGNPVTTVLSGFSFHYIRDDRPVGIPDRADHMWHILQYLGNYFDEPTVAKSGISYANGLAQNYPNPFNPSTTIEYSIKEQAYVSLAIYNVAGQLVKTLVSEEKSPGIYRLQWNAENNGDIPVASGVYFCKMVTKHFNQTRKLIVLK